MMTQRKLGQDGPVLAAIGLGCMGMSEFYGDTNDAVSLDVLSRAYELGARFFDTADTYGNGHNERLVAKFIADRTASDAFVATKFGIRRAEGAYERVIDNTPKYMRQACEASLKKLGVEAIGLYYVHRIDTDIPIEDTVGAMSRLVEEGKVLHLGLCEVSAPTLRRAHATHPIAAVQNEYSLTTREVEAEVLPTCTELGIALVAYSPLGRGLLSGTITTSDALAENDFRRIAPRFSGDNLRRNLEQLGTLNAIAQNHDATAAQIALAWVLAQGDVVFAIPGTKRLKYLEQNMAAAKIALSAQELADLNAAMPIGSAVGERYPKAGQIGLEA